ncbi:MAG TPA: TonB-dependent siderophore receptor [Polyangiaceae bacterium]
MGARTIFPNGGARLRASRVLISAALAAPAVAQAQTAEQPAKKAAPEIEIDVTAPARKEPSYATSTQVTATREERKVADLPLTVTAITHDAIDDRDAHRTNDVLMLAPGVQFFSGYGGTWDDYTLRGFHIWSATTFRNGFLSGYSGANAIDVVNVERIEVIRGPASALYGPGLPGGAINFVTKRPSEQARSRVGISVGSFDTARAELDTTGPLSDGVLYRLTAAGDTSSGYRDFNTFRRYVINPVVSLRLARDTWLLAEVQAYEEAYRADPYGVPQIAGNSQAFPVARSFAEPALPLATTSGQLGRVELFHELSPRWSLRVATQTQLGRYDEEALNPALLDTDGRSLIRVLSNWQSHSADTALQVALRGKFATGSLEHELIAGVDARREIVDYRIGLSDPTVDPYVIDVFDPHYGSPLPSAPLPPGRLDRWTYESGGVYANDLVKLAPGLNLLGGARADTYRQTSATSTLFDKAGEPALTGRTGVVYQLIEQSALYGNLSTGFWPVLGIQGDGHVLKPEHSFAWELGQRTSLGREQLTFDAVLFDIKNRNISVIDPTNTNFQIQRGRAESRGVELALTARLARHLRAMASYAYTHAVVTDDPDPKQIGSNLPLSARHAGAGFIEWLVLPGLSVGPGLVYTSKRSLVDQSEIPGYVRFDARVAYRHGRVESSLFVQNVLDRRYTLSGTNALGVLPGAPRNVQLTTRVSF